MKTILVLQHSVASPCVMRHARHCSREQINVWKEISVLQSSMRQETHANAQNSLNQGLNLTSQVPTKMDLQQLQVPAFWTPGSCSSYCCQVADPQPTITGTYGKVQDTEWHLATPWCLCTGRFSLKGCCQHCAT